MTLNITIYAIMAAFFGLGIFLIVASFAIPRVMSNRFVEDADGTKRIGSVAEAQVLSAMVADLGKTIGKEKGDLEELLRKSGYIYQSSQEYYARRIYTSLITAVLGGALGYFLDLGFLIIAALVTGGLFYGFSMPSRAVQKTIKTRRERIQDEMGFGLEQLVNLLNTGTSLSDSLSQMRDFGLFGKICDTVSSGLQTNKEIDSIVYDVTNSVPAPSQLREFLGLIKQSQIGGEVQVHAMQTMARMLRQRLSNRILEIGGRAKVKAVLVNTMIIVLASLIILGVPAVSMFMGIGFF